MADLLHICEVCDGNSIYNELIVNRSSFLIRGLASTLVCFLCLSATGAEYCLRPGKKDGAQTNSVVCCSTPAGWQGWKDDPSSQQRIKQFGDAYSRGWVGKMVVFHQPDCKEGPECPHLGLDTRSHDSRDRPDIETGLRDFVNEWEQPQDRSPRKPPCVVLSRVGSFHTENSGDPTIWRIRCPSGDQLFVTLLALRDVLVTIDLGEPISKISHPISIA
jgi:hypothetical protein